MSDKLSDVQAHIASVRGLESVVGAMRAIAAARAQEARNRLDGIRACAAIIGNAIGDALMLDGGAKDTDGHGEHKDAGLRIVFCAEQGFVGTFSERVVADAARSVPTQTDDYFLIGNRGRGPAADHGLDVVWSASMMARADDVAPLADRITQALYERMDAGRATRVALVHAIPTTGEALEIVERDLLPFDFDRFARPARRIAPIVTMAPRRLLAKLAQEYVYAQLCEAIMLSFSAENEARMRAMIAARTNIRRSLDELVDESRRMRQEEITSEIVELSAGSLAAGNAARLKKPKR